MEAFNNEFFSLKIAPAIEKLPPPLSQDEVIRVIEDRGLVKIQDHPYLPDGIHVRGWDLENSDHISALEQIIPASLQAVDQVNDEHFTQKTLLDLALAKALWLELDGQELKVTITFRFTVDDCDAGTRMMNKVQSGVAEALGDSGFRVDVETLHGGSDWNVEEVQDACFREILREALKRIK